MLRGGGWRRRRREYEELSRHVAVERDGAQILIGRGVVQVDRVAGYVDVQHLAVGARLQAHPRTPLELDAVREAMVLEIELPELVVADLVIQAVGALAIGRDREADRRRRSQR